MAVFGTGILSPDGKSKKKKGADDRRKKWVVRHGMREERQRKRAERWRKREKQIKRNRYERWIGDSTYRASQTAL